MSQSMDTNQTDGALHAHYRDDPQPHDGPLNGSAAGEEELRFIRNFHDVFLSIGIGLFAIGLGIFTSLMIPQLTGVSLDGGDIDGEIRGLLAVPGIVYLIDAAIMWGIAEIFARSRRLFLPAIVILIAFTGFAVSGVTFLYSSIAGDFSGDFEQIANQFRAFPLVLSLTATIAILAYYFRMKLPFAMGTGAASLAGVFVSLAIFVDPDLVFDNVWLWLFGSGMFLFFLGIYFDARDPERKTRLSDNGFWLHLFAAPMIFISVTTMIAGEDRFTSSDAFPAIATLVIVFIFALISLILNRRALVVSGLVSAASALGILFSKSGIDAAYTIALTLLMLGAAMILLGGGWKTVRRFVIKPFPKTGFISRIVPPETIID